MFDRIASGPGTSGLPKTPKNSVFVNVIGEFEEIHIRNRQIVFDGLNLGRNRTKTTAAFRIQVDDKDREFRMSDRDAVDHENE
jgi:hypothetical protein